MLKECCSKCYIMKTNQWIKNIDFIYKLNAYVIIVGTNWEISSESSVWEESHKIIKWHMTERWVGMRRTADLDERAWDHAKTKLCKGGLQCISIGKAVKRKWLQLLWKVQYTLYIIQYLMSPSVTMTIPWWLFSGNRFKVNRPKRIIFTKDTSADTSWWDWINWTKWD